MTTTSSANDFFNGFLGLRPDLGSRIRRHGEGISRFAQDALNRLESLGVPRTDHYDHSAFQSPWAQGQAHGIFRFDDDSLLVVFDHDLMVVAHARDAVVLRDGPSDVIFVGAWDGGNIHALRDTVLDGAVRLGARTDAEIGVLVSAMDIPHRTGACARHPYAALGALLALDRHERALVLHEDHLFDLSTQAGDLRLELLHAQRAQERLQELDAGAESVSPCTHRLRVLQAAAELLHQRWIKTRRAAVVRELRPSGVPARQATAA